jgi:hypothetical protein
MEQRRVNRYCGLLADADLEPVLPDLAERCSGVRKASRVPAEVERRPSIPWRGATERQNVARQTALAQTRGRCDGVVGTRLIGGRDPYAETPSRHFRCASGERGVALDHLRGIAPGDQKQVERFVVHDQAVRPLRPVGIADAVQHARGRVHIDAPGAAAGAGAPAERRTVARCSRRGAGRLDLRMHQLAALVQRRSLRPEAVHRFTRRERVRRQPRLSVSRTADRRQSRLAVARAVGDRSEHRLAGVQQAQGQRRSRELERSIACGERPQAARRLGDIAALRAGRDQSVVGTRVRTDARRNIPEPKLPISSMSPVEVANDAPDADAPRLLDASIGR